MKFITPEIEQRALLAGREAFARWMEARDVKHPHTVRAIRAGTLDYHGSVQLAKDAALIAMTEIL